MKKSRALVHLYDDRVDRSDYATEVAWFVRTTELQSSGNRDCNTLACLSSWIQRSSSSTLPAVSCEYLSDTGLVLTKPVANYYSTVAPAVENVTLPSNETEPCHHDCKTTETDDSSCDTLTSWCTADEEQHEYEDDLPCQHRDMVPFVQSPSHGTSLSVPNGSQLSTSAGITTPRPPTSVVAGGATTSTPAVSLTPPPGSTASSPATSQRFSDPSLIALTQLFWDTADTLPIPLTHHSHSTASPARLSKAEYMRIRMLCFMQLLPETIWQQQLELLCKVCERDYVVDSKDEPQGLTLPMFHSSLCEFAIHWCQQPLVTDFLQQLYNHITVPNPAVKLLDHNTSFRAPSPAVDVTTTPASTTSQSDRTHQPLPLPFTHQIQYKSKYSSDHHTTPNQQASTSTSLDSTQLCDSNAVHDEQSPACTNSTPSRVYRELLLEVCACLHAVEQYMLKHRERERSRIMKYRAQAIKNEIASYKKAVCDKKPSLQSTYNTASPVTNNASTDSNNTYNYYLHHHNNGSQTERAAARSKKKESGAAESTVSTKKKKKKKKKAGEDENSQDGSDASDDEQAAVVSKKKKKKRKRKVATDNDSNSSSATNTGNSTAVSTPILTSAPSTARPTTASSASSIASSSKYESASNILHSARQLSSSSLLLSAASTHASHPEPDVCSPHKHHHLQHELPSLSALSLMSATTTTATASTATSATVEAISRSRDLLCELDDMLNDKAHKPAQTEQPAAVVASQERTATIASPHAAASPSKPASVHPVVAAVSTSVSTTVALSPAASSQSPSTPVATLLKPAARTHNLISFDRVTSKPSTASVQSSHAPPRASGGDTSTHSLYPAQRVEPVLDEDKLREKVVKDLLKYQQRQQKDSVRAAIRQPTASHMGEEVKEQTVSASPVSRTASITSQAAQRSQRLASPALSGGNTPKAVVEYKEAEPAWNSKEAAGASIAHRASAVHDRGHSSSQMPVKPLTASVALPTWYLNMTTHDMLLTTGSQSARCHSPATAAPATAPAGSRTQRVMASCSPSIRRVVTPQTMLQYTPLNISSSIATHSKGAQSVVSAYMTPLADLSLACAAPLHPARPSKPRR